MKTLRFNLVETISKIGELAEYRESYIRENGKTPPFRPSAEKLGLSAEDIHAYAPELYMEWYDPDFHCSLPKEHSFH
jgi:hypothetical protein